MREKEIEFKNLLSEEDYNKLFNHFELASVDTINNYNYYFDKDNILKNFGAALRIRHTNVKSEITLKIKKDTYNIEVNVPLENNTTPEKISFKQLPKQIQQELNSCNITFDEIYLFQKIETLRKEKKLDYGLLVVDKTTFLGNVVDYELEFEVDNYEKGLIAFTKILTELNIQKKEAMPKIARAVSYYKK